MQRASVFTVFWWVISGACCALCGCTPSDDVVATLIERPGPPPPEEPKPTCPPKTFRLVVLNANGDVLALEKDTFVLQSKKPLACLAGQPLLSMTSNASGVPFISTKVGLQQVSDTFSACGEVYDSKEPLEATAFAKGPKDTGEQLYGFGTGTFWHVQLEPKMAVNTRIGAVRPGLSVKSLSVDGNGRLLAFIEEKDAIRVGPVDLLAGTISPVWSIARPPGEPFWGAVEREGRFEVLFGYTLRSFDPSTGILTGLAKLPSDLPLPGGQLLLSRQRCL